MKKEHKIERIHLYYDGMIAGITKYAHWKDGVQYVGTCGKTLNEAIDMINKERDNYITTIEEDTRRITSELGYSRVGKDAMRRG